MVPADDPSILVPIDVSQPAAPDPHLVELLHPLRIVLLGYYLVPDQAAPDQLRAEYETEATETIERIATEFLDRGADVDPIVVFTRDRSASVDRVADERGCDAVLTPGDARAIDRVLVPLRGDVNLERIVRVVAELLEESHAGATLYHGVGTEEDATESEFILRGAVDRLVEDGVDEDRLEWEQSETESAAEDIIARAEDYDLVVLGETEPSLKEHILGDVPSQIIDRTGRPVLVIRDVT